MCNYSKALYYNLEKKNRSRWRDGGRRVEEGRKEESREGKDGGE